MNDVVRLSLNPTPAQAQRLAALQHAFAAACNALAPVVQQTRCWNRVGLHHLAYKQMRERFPGLGSQMVCNAIYSVSRACRVVYQHPDSPFNVGRLDAKPLPRVQFLPQAPVYFDRHTLSIKAGQISLFTLDGRMRFELGVSADDEQRFRRDRLREIVLSGDKSKYALTFIFAPADDAVTPDADAQPSGELPEYVLVVDDGRAPPNTRQSAPQPT